MKNFTKLNFFSFLLSVMSFHFVMSQTSPVTITVDWDEASYLNKVDVYDPANNLLLSICNPDDCYTSSGSLDSYAAIFDLGCIPDANGYYVKLFNVDGVAWVNTINDQSTVTVTVDGTNVINDDGANANIAGFDVFFNVSGGAASCAALPDTDGDGVIDTVDLDDDNDGIADTDEALGINSFDCTIPALDFVSGVYDVSASTGPAESVGAVYRFANALEGYDVLVEVLSITGCTLLQIDDDTVDNVAYLQTRIEFSGLGTPGIDYRFTIVDSGTTTPAATLFRIGGTTWDVDGVESVEYTNPSAYGTDNPTLLEVSDLGAGIIRMSSTGLQEGPGFSTLPQLRSYFQFLSNTFDLRMQLIKGFTGTTNREFSMSFTQCDVLDFNAASLIIVNGEDEDNDGLDNHLDIDSDNDGIPDNIEAQPTSGYIAPNNLVDALSGIDTAYLGGLIYTDTDGDRILDYLDSDSDNDGIPDIDENGMTNSVVAFTDSDNDGLDDDFEGGNLSDAYDVNDEIDNPSSSVLPDFDGDVLTGGDLDYRDTSADCSSGLDTDNDGLNDFCDLDDDNDGILDTIECERLAFFEDFGTGIRTETPYTNYCFEDGLANGSCSGFADGFINDGEYAVADIPNDGPFFSTWVDNVLDHTPGDTNGRAAIFNASGAAGEFYRRPIDITPLSQVRISLFILNLIKSGNNFITPDVLIQIEDSSGNVIGSSSSGNIPEDEIWHEYETIFSAGNNSTIDIVLINNNPGGQGNDLAIDDITAAEIVSPCDTDNDGLANDLDIDSDNDGIPDNVEAQATNAYIQPSGTINAITGVDVAYGFGISTPEDTDNDGIQDYIDLDSDSDGTPDIEENGMANSFGTFDDADNDGLEDIFETNGINDVVLDVNEDIEDPTNLSILPDTDGDLPTGGDLDYRDATDFGSASIDFDGVDDYLDAPSFMAGWSEVTIMAWVKLASDFATGADIAGENMFRVQVMSDQEVQLYMILDASNTSYTIDSNVSLPLNEWHHLTVSYQGSTGEASLYIDGELEQVQGFPVGILSTNPLYADPNFAIGRFTRLQNSYFKGAIDEVRVFDTILTADQIQRMVYQEINQNGSNLKGSLIDKDIVDINSNSTIPWSNLQGYWPMNNIAGGKTADKSTYNREATLNNITTIQPQTAPIPFETVLDGDWNQESTWLHGDVWDIEDISSNKDWSIVHIQNDITTNVSHTQLGMFIDAGNSLTVSGDQAITNTWYLSLDGTLDLSDDSQLVQGVNSDLVTSATGNILRRQEGNTSVYWYNYWSSPVGALGATTLSNNNSTSNNPNNSTFNIAMLKDGAGDPFTFTSSFDDTGNISNRWLYSYQNGQTFWDWTTLTPSSAILPGVGYTQKGTGNGGTEQQYIFDGKPNNGTILIQADDVDGDSANESEQDVTLTTTFVGNPYPSAIDARQFIIDNNGVTGGSVYVWEQWGGTNHILEDYQGGYGTINMATTEKAYQFNDPTETESPLARKPTFYIPVAQGFFVEVVNDGDNGVLSATDDIEFNNGQRVFIKESDADGTNPNNGSEFFRNAENNQEVNDTSEMSMMRLELNVSNGNSRSFVLAFSDQTTDGFDYGYDARTIDPQDDDMNSFIGEQKMLIQSFSPITVDKVIDLVFNSTGSLDYTLEVIEFNSIDENQNIYLRDNLTSTYFDLRTGSYNFSSDVNGEDTERFDIVFRDETLFNHDFVLDDVLMFSKNRKLFVKNINEEVKSLSLINMLGQTVKILDEPSVNSLENGIYIGDLSSGVYLINLITNNNIKLDNKIILE